jgi:lipopolysaccharide export system protein LptA
MRLPDSTANTFIGGGFIGRCQGENNRISADSAEQFESAGIVNIYGNVVYEEPKKLRVTAAHAIYLTREGRLFADGGVVATQLATGSTITGPNIEYSRVMPGRPVAKLVAPNRPTARLIEKDSTGKLGEPTIVTADRFEDLGDTLLLGWGDVVITREQIVGRADSLAFNKTTQRARLVRAARIRSLDTAQAFTLNGDTIDLYTTEKKLDRVFASHAARATNKDLIITAERIDLRLKAQQIDEAFAFGSGRARAQTPQQDVESDSMRIVLTDQRPREVRAIGGAVAKGMPDTLKIKSTDRDMLRGDSLFAYFDTAQVATDTSGQTRIREIQAFGNASSLFQIASKRGPTAPPAINYVRGQRIVVQFDTGSVRDVRVDSAASGLYLEPAQDSLGDSTVAKRSVPPPPAKKPPLATAPRVPEPSTPSRVSPSRVFVTLSRRPS